MYQLCMHSLDADFSHYAAREFSVLAWHGNIKDSILVAFYVLGTCMSGSGRILASPQNTRKQKLKQANFQCQPLFASVMAGAAQGRPVRARV
jgi:hypothetical protein